MRLNELNRKSFLPPEVDDANFEYEDRLKHIIPYLQKDCSDALKACKDAKKLVYRGLNTGIDHFTSAINANRPPRYLATSMHEMTNTVMTEMGAKAHRGNAIFCAAGSSNMAAAWGTVYMIFPYNGFSVTWFEKEKRGYIFDSLHDLFDEDVFIRGDEKKRKELVREVLTELGMKHGDGPAGLSAAFNSGAVELLISGSQYIGLKDTMWVNQATDADPNAGYSVGYGDVVKQWLGVPPEKPTMTL